MQTQLSEKEKQPKNKKFLLADLILWKEISGRRIGNCRFMRQETVEGLLVDYYCPDKKLVIQIASAHKGIALQNEISIGEMLESKGYKVLRFDYNKVLNDIENVISEIKMQLI